MSVAEIVACDDLFEIEVSDLCSAPWATRGGYAPGHRLSIHLRARRFAASLLAMLLVALSLAPGARWQVTETLRLMPAGARGAAPPALPMLTRFPSPFAQHAEPSPTAVEQPICPAAHPSGSAATGCGPLWKLEGP